ncbi:MAG: DHH family phosphoesterase [Planctomycetota bacterium]|jgi:phosphoesterase RecJ-like protein
MTTDQWTTNTTLPEVVTRLRNASTVLAATHTKPDGDALGSTLALVRTLRSLDIEATAAYTGPWAHRFDPVIAQTPVIHTGIESVEKGKLNDPELVAILDTGSWSQLAELESFLRPRADRNIVVDHHLHGDPEIATARIIETHAAAACQTVAKICVSLLELDSPSDLPLDIATPLYLGIATDTGWFKFSNVSPETLELAAQLLRTGLNHAALYETIEQADRPQRLLLEARALGSMQLHEKETVSICTITKNDYAQTNGGPEDTGSFSSIPLRIATVLVSAVLTERETDHWKISLRSKTAPTGGPAVNVNHIAVSLGGGGHAQAAGCAIQGSRDHVTSRLLDAIRNQMHATTNA